MKSWWIIFLGVFSGLYAYAQPVADRLLNPDSIQRIFFARPRPGAAVARHGGAARLADVAALRHRCFAGYGLRCEASIYSDRTLCSVGTERRLGAACPQATASRDVSPTRCAGEPEQVRQVYQGLPGGGRIGAQPGEREA